MKISVRSFLSIILLIFFSSSVSAQVEPGYSPGTPPGLITWYSPAGETEKSADLDFIKGMRPHHAGALTMSDDYLGSKDASNAVLKQLARAIIRNQEFEILMLETIQDLHKKSDAKTNHAFGLRPAAMKRLSRHTRFMRSPAPGPLDKWMGKREISVRDVQFAKAMIIHHEAALTMAQDYLDNEHGKNRYLQRMCLDILLDQAQEIALMQSIVDAYPGDANAIKIDASMIHGMEGMQHGVGHRGKAPASKTGHQGHH
jgi:uncharacterized protein (DUF305 family)